MSVGKWRYELVFRWQNLIGILVAQSLCSISICIERSKKKHNNHIFFFYHVLILVHAKTLRRVQLVHFQINANRFAMRCLVAHLFVVFVLRVSQILAEIFDLWTPIHILLIFFLHCIRKYQIQI